jgi:hypothetical protein
MYFVQNIQFVCGPTKKTYNIPITYTYSTLRPVLCYQAFFPLSLTLVSFLDHYILFYTINNMMFKYFYCWARVNFEGISTHVVNGNKCFHLIITIIKIFNINCLKKQNRERVHSFMGQR